MEQEKSLNNLLDEEELLKALESEGTTTESDDDVVQFISQFEIKPGENPLRRGVLYPIYNKWSKTPVTFNSFNKSISRFFKSNTRYIFINLDLIKISKIILNQKIKKRPQNRLHSSRYQEHFANFCKEYEIRKGDFYISWSALMYHYKKWVEKSNSKINIRHGKTFIDFCKANFNIKQPENMILQVGLHKSIIYYIPHDVITKLRNDTNGYDKKPKKEKSPIDS